MTHIGLFEGGGFFSLVIEWMNWHTVAYSENNYYCNKLLKKRFPNAKCLGDITTVNFKEYAHTIDIITGGFPCQPFSTSGEGKGEEDERWLYEEMLRAVRAIKPRWIVGENVRGITSPKFSKTFEYICASLEAEGYKVQPIIIPASAIGADHERYRVWFIAHAPSIRLSGQGQLLGRMQPEKIKDREANRFINFIQRNSMPYVCGEHNGRTRKLDEHRLHILGNMIMPQIFHSICQSIDQYENTIL